MADIKRTRVFAMADGVCIENDGSIKEESVTVTGNFRTLENAEKAVRRHFPDFLPKDVRVVSCTYSMDENRFFDEAAKGDYQQILPEEDSVESKKK